MVAFVPWKDGVVGSNPTWAISGEGLFTAPPSFLPKQKEFEMNKTVYYSTFLSVNGNTTLPLGSEFSIDFWRTQVSTLVKEIKTEKKKEEIEGLLDKEGKFSLSQYMKQKKYV